MSDGGNERVRIGLAKVLKATLERFDELLRLDPWLPVPQSGCTFSFGERKAPLPIGALHRILERAPHVEGTCSRCGGFIMPFVFGGLERKGGFKGCCIECGQTFYLPLGGAQAVARFVRPALAGTPFAITEVLEDQAKLGSREPLWRALRQLGVDELPDEDWSRGCDCLEPWPRPESDAAPEPGDDSSPTSQDATGGDGSDEPQPALGDGGAAANDTAPDDQPTVPPKPAPRKPALRKRRASRRDRLQAFWSRVRREASDPARRLFRPVESPVSLRALRCGRPLVMWGTHDPFAPRIGVVALAPVPNEDRVALWVSKLGPFAEHDAVHGVVPRKVAADPEALRVFLGEAFALPLPFHRPILDGVPTFVCPLDGSTISDDDWAAIVRRAPAFAHGRALADALADFERFNGDPSKIWAAGRARHEVRRHELVRPPQPLDEAAYKRWWDLASSTAYVNNALKIVAGSWDGGTSFVDGAVPAAVSGDEAEAFFEWLGDGRARAAEREAARSWRLHEFGPDWYGERGLPALPLPVRHSRLADDTSFERLSVRALLEDLVDWVNESKDRRGEYGPLIERLASLVDGDEGCEGATRLGLLECATCGHTRPVTREFLQSASIPYNELPRRAAALRCSWCNGTGARWSGPMN